VTELRRLSSRHRPVFVDGGVRAETVGALAAAGAAGVIPGSLVFDAPDPGAAIDSLHRLG
jgi:ribulose-phosphate 3-epimerase